MIKWVTFASFKGLLDLTSTLPAMQIELVHSTNHFILFFLLFSIFLLIFSHLCHQMQMHPIEESVGKEPWDSHFLSWIRITCNVGLWDRWGWWDFAKGSSLALDNLCNESNFPFRTEKKSQTRHVASSNQKDKSPLNRFSPSYYDWCNRYQNFTWYESWFDMRC